MTMLLLSAAAMNPCAGRSGQARVRSKRREGKQRLPGWNLGADVADHLSYAVQKQVRALHDATAQGDRIRGKNRDQVGQSEPDVVAFAFHGAARQLVAAAGKLADLCGSQFAGIRSEE